MAIVLRIQKGDVLTFEELDGNFTDLDSRVTSLEAGGTTDGGSGIPYTADTDDTLLYVEGTYDFGNNIIKYANAIDQESQLVNYDAGTYHGMTMHVHSTGALYYAHAGAWRKLLTDVTYGDPESFGYNNPLSAVAYSNAYSDLTGTPDLSVYLTSVEGTVTGSIVPDSDVTYDLGSSANRFRDLYLSGSSINLGNAVITASGTSVALPEGTTIGASTDPISTFDGQFASLTGTPTTLAGYGITDASLANLTDVSTEGVTTGQVLKYNGVSWAPASDLQGDGTGGITLADLSVNVQAAGTANLVYNNTTGVFSYTPPDLSSFTTLTDLSVSVAAAGTANLAYNNATGVFTYTPPQLGDFTFSGTTLDTAGSAAITVTPDVTFSSAVSFTTLSSTGTGTLTLDSASSIALTATDAINITAGTGSIVLDNQSWPQADGTAGQYLQTDGLGQLSWASVAGTADQNIFATVAGDLGSTTADTTADTLTIAGGTDISTSVSGDIVTIAFTGTSSGTTQNLFETFAADSGSTTADTATDNLTVSGGTDITTSISGDVLTISYTGTSSGIANVVEDTTPQLGGDLDVNGSTVLYTFSLGANGTSDYIFSDPGNIWFPTSENDPIIYLRRGETYQFTNISSTHPFEIRQAANGSAFNTGVTNNGGSGTVTFAVPMSAPSTLYYQCTSHSAMGNTINVV